MNPQALAFRSVQSVKSLSTRHMDAEHSLCCTADLRKGTQCVKAVPPTWPQLLPRSNQHEPIQVLQTPSSTPCQVCDTNKAANCQHLTVQTLSAAKTELTLPKPTHKKDQKSTAEPYQTSESPGTSLVNGEAGFLQQLRLKRACRAATGSPAVGSAAPPDGCPSRDPAVTTLRWRLCWALQGCRGGRLRGVRGTEGGTLQSLLQASTLGEDEIG